MALDDESAPARALGSGLLPIVRELRHCARQGRGIVGGNDHAAMMRANEIGLARIIGDDRWNPGRQRLEELQGKHAGASSVAATVNNHETSECAGDDATGLLV